MKQFTECQIKKSKAIKDDYVGCVSFYDGEICMTVFTRKGVRKAREILREFPEKVFVKECKNPPYYF